MPVEDFLTGLGGGETCTILLQSQGKQDLRGGPAREPHVVAQAGVPFLLRELAAANDPKNGKATETKTVRLYFHPDDLDAPVTSKHRVEAVAGDGTVRSFVVAGSVNYNSLGALLAVDCTEQPV